MGRWLSRDPLGEAGGFNLYAYCGNDPVNRHDPLGLSAYGDLLDSAAEDLAGGRYIKGYGKTTVAALWEAFSFRAASGVGEVQDLYDDGEITGAQAISSASIKVARSSAEMALSWGGSGFAKGLVSGGSTILRRGLRTGVLGGGYGGSEALLDVAADRGVSAVEGRAYSGTFGGDALKVATNTAIGFSLGAIAGTGAAALQKSLSNASAKSGLLAKYADGQGFSGVFIPGRGGAMRPSIYGPVPAGWVPAKGGHGKVMIELANEGADVTNAQAFTAFKRGNHLEIEWFSGGVNGTNLSFEGDVLPEKLRPPILKVLEQATGMKAFSTSKH